MKSILVVSVLMVSLCLFGAAVFIHAAGKSGQELFKERCAACHPDGGNILTPAYTLHKKNREAIGVKTAADIVEKMRHPGPGMPRFDETMIPDKDATAIAEYILKTFQ
jgi:cytochrome c6